LLGATVTVGAQAEATKEEVAVARQYFDSATRAEKEGRWRDAIEDLNKAIAIKETAGLRYHLGFAKENLGQLVEALLDYQRAAGLIRSGMTTEEVERFVVPKLEEIRKRVPTLTVQVPPDVKDAELRIDGTLVKRQLIGTAIPLNPGTHALVVFASGRRPFHVQVSLGEGSAVTQSAELVPEVGGGVVAAASPAPSAPPPPASRTQSEREKPTAESNSSAKTWVLLGEGAFVAVGLGIGVGYLAAANSVQKDIDDANLNVGENGCRPPIEPSRQAACDTLETGYSDRNRNRNIAVAGFIGAGVGAAALIGTWVFWKSTSQSQTRVIVAPEVGSYGAGFVVRGAY